MMNDPLAKAPSTVVCRGAIVSNDAVATSIARRGLLDRLPCDEILDTIARVHVRGESESGVFGKRGEH